MSEAPQKTESKKAARSHRKDRLTVTPENLKKLESWTAVVKRAYPSLKVKPQGILNEILSQCPDLPTKKDLDRIYTAHFDEVAHLQWVLSEARKAKSKGESFDMKTHLSAPNGLDVKTNKRRKENASKRSENKGKEDSETQDSSGKESKPGHCV